MKSSFLQDLSDFIAETEPLIEGVNELSKETAIEIYSMYETAAMAATQNIEIIDTELRVILCDRLDRILEQIIDISSSLGQIDLHGIYTPAINAYRRWGNVELLKDKGLTGYMLAKELGTRPIMMFGTNPAEYANKDLLPELEILYTDVQAGDSRVYFEHLHKEHLQMDILILHGMYNDTIGYLDTYRKYRPDGKVYCGLDMNGYWMEKITWDSVAVTNFSKQCDIIATSCRSLRDALNRNPKVSFPCRWIPNGFLNPFNTTVIADSRIKKNIILTVGRIGTNQKNNGELLIAFERVYGKMPGWELRLVGTIEPSFRPFIDKYFKVFPHMRSKVTFTGAITNKSELYREYAQAKLFALTSQIEGFPNVYAEALVHGCMFITSDIDAADDITNFGELGLKYKCGDIDGLANSLVKLSEQTDNEKLKKHISKALLYANKHFDWHRNTKKLAYMLYG